MLLERCLCGSERFRKEEINGINVCCCDCGITRQLVEMKNEEYRKFYENDYHGVLHKHTRQQDEKVAQLRLKAYNLPYNSKVLDVGSSNGAFVDACQAKGMIAYGVDVANFGHNRTYIGDLLDIHFPADHFDVVTMHDLLEHVEDPMKTLKESARILRPNGTLIVDFPDFYSRDGKHHWREKQHLWMFTREQLIELIEDAGFFIEELSYPIPGKFVIKARRKEQKRNSILVLPGIGDIYWTMVKMEAIIKEESFSDVVDVAIMTDGRRDRSNEYVEKIPFCHFTSYHLTNYKTPLFHEMYMQAGRTIVKYTDGFDAIVSYNGVLRNGMSLDTFDNLATNWYFPMFESLSEQWHGRLARNNYGKYILVNINLNGDGMFQNWLDEWPKKEIIKTLIELAHVTNRTILLVGKEWDVCKDIPWPSSIIDLTGKTTLTQLFALIRNASLVLGFCSGLTIKATYFKKSTVMIWNNYLPDARFFHNACPPDSLGDWYTPLNTKEKDFSKRVIRACLAYTTGGC